LSDLTSDYFSEELDNINKTASSQQQSDSNGGSGASTPSGSFVGDRIQMLGGTQQGFKRPVAPGRRRPQVSSAPTSSSSITTENTTSSA
jgi:twinfilin-like protein